MEIHHDIHDFSSWALLRSCVPFDFGLYSDYTVRI